MTSYIKLLAGRLEYPREGEVFEVAPRDTISSVVKERFNKYGLTIRVKFIITKVRASRSIKIHYKHFGK